VPVATAEGGMIALGCDHGSKQMRPYGNGHAATIAGRGNDRRNVVMLVDTFQPVVTFPLVPVLLSRHGFLAFSAVATIYYISKNASGSLVADIALTGVVRLNKP